MLLNFTLSSLSYSVAFAEAPNTSILKNSNSLIQHLKKWKPMQKMWWVKETEIREWGGWGSWKFQGRVTERKEQCRGALETSLASFESAKNYTVHVWGETAQTRPRTAGEPGAEWFWSLADLGKLEFQTAKGKPSLITGHSKAVRWTMLS